MSQEIRIEFLFVEDRKVADGVNSNGKMLCGGKGEGSIGVICTCFPSGDSNCIRPCHHNIPLSHIQPPRRSLTRFSFPFCPGNNRTRYRTPCEKVGDMFIDVVRKTMQQWWLVPQRDALKRGAWPPSVPQPPGRKVSKRRPVMSLRSHGGSLGERRCNPVSISLLDFYKQRSSWAALILPQFCFHKVSGLIDGRCGHLIFKSGLWEGDGKTYV